MVANPDYDLARPLASALKAKAPYVGIPIPGHAPLIFNRDKLQRALRGVKPVYIDVTVHENGERSLVVEGVASPHCRTSMRLRSLHRSVFNPNRYSAPYMAMEKWNPLKAKAPRVTKYDKAIAKLERQLAKLGNRPEIANPCVTSSAPRDGESFLRWRQQKGLRRKIGRLAVQVCAGKMTAHEFYAGLGKLTKVKRYSDFTEKWRERILGKAEHGRNGFSDFANPKNLWKFLPELEHSWMHSRPRLYWGTWQEWQQEQLKECWGAQRYAPILEWSRKRQELHSQIAAVRAMIEPESPGSGPQTA